VLPRVTVLRDGRMIASKPSAEMDRQSIVDLMLGKVAERNVAERNKVERRGATAREGLVVIDRLSAPGHVTDFGLRLNGARSSPSQARLARARARSCVRSRGLPFPDARGHVSIAGRAMRLGAPQRSIKAGAVFASNDRKSEGLFSASVRRTQSSGDSPEGGEPGRRCQSSPFLSACATSRRVDRVRTASGSALRRKR